MRPYPKILRTTVDADRDLRAYAAEYEIQPFEALVVAIDRLRDPVESEALRASLNKATATIESITAAHDVLLAEIERIRARELVRVGELESAREATRRADAEVERLAQDLDEARAAIERLTAELAARDAAAATGLWGSTPLERGFDFVARTLAGALAEIGETPEPQVDKLAEQAARVIRGRAPADASPEARAEEEPPWNWCPRCKQTVDDDMRTGEFRDGSEGTCLGCGTVYVAVAYSDDHWALVSREENDWDASRPALTEEQAQAWHPFTPGMTSEALCAFCGKTAAEHVGPTMAAMSAALSGLGWVQDDVGLWAEEGNGCHLWGTHDAFRSAARKIEALRASRGEAGEPAKAPPVRHPHHDRHCMIYDGVGCSREAGCEVEK